MLNRNQVAERLGKHVDQFYRIRLRGDFPKPDKVCKSTKGIEMPYWRESTVKRYEIEQEFKKNRSKNFNAYEFAFNNMIKQ